MSRFKTQQKRALATLAVKPNEEPVSGVEAWALASSLTHDDEVVRVWDKKFRGRPAQAVRSVSREIREARPEQRQGIITRFAKEVPAVRRVA